MFMSSTFNCWWFFINKICYNSTGVHGHIQTGNDHKPLVNAILKIQGHSKNISIDPQTAEFHRVLPPGRHFLIASAPGYMAVRRQVDIVPNQVSSICTLCVLSKSLIRFVKRTVFVKVVTKMRGALQSNHYKW